MRARKSVPAISRQQQRQIRRHFCVWFLVFAHAAEQTNHEAQRRRLVSCNRHQKSCRNAGYEIQKK
eukprot:1913270-Rhodomonas_salina.2